MNTIFIAGHLGADPETRFTTNGQKVTTMRVATNVRKAGKDETIWWRVTIWGDRFDKILPYLKKGSAIIVTGELGKPEIYTDKEGRPQISLEITAEAIKFNPFGKSDKTGQETAQPQNSAPMAHAGSQSQYAQESGFSEYSFPQQSSQPFAGVQGKVNHAKHQDEEEPLPF